MMRPTINEESDCLRKKNLRRHDDGFAENIFTGVARLGVGGSASLVKFWRSLRKFIL